MQCFGNKFLFSYQIRPIKLIFVDFVVVLFCLLLVRLLSECVTENIDMIRKIPSKCKKCDCNNWLQTAWPFEEQNNENGALK